MSMPIISYRFSDAVILCKSLHQRRVYGRMTGLKWIPLVQQQHFKSNIGYTYLEMCKILYLKQCILLRLFPNGHNQRGEVEIECYNE